VFSYQIPQYNKLSQQKPTGLTWWLKKPVQVCENICFSRILKIRKSTSSTPIPRTASYFEEKNLRAPKIMK